MSGDMSKFDFMKVNTESGYRGVYCRGRGIYEAKIGVDSTILLLGHFDSLYLAVKARHDAEIKYNWHKPLKKISRSDFTQSDLKKAVTYDEGTGYFYWAIDHKHGKKGDRADTVDCTGHMYVMVNSESYATHRLAVLYMTGEWPVELVERINGIKQDNRWSNLREISIAESHKNMVLAKNNTSGVVGVSYNNGKKMWAADIGVNGKGIHLGYFVKKEDAIKARKAAEAKYGFHVNHGRSKK